MGFGAANPALDDRASRRRATRDGLRGWPGARTDSGLRAEFWHASIGILIFGLTILRLVWREANPAPALPADTNRFLAWFAHFTHFAFYALLILDPVLGYFTGCAHGDPLTFFGLPLPSLIAKSKPLGHKLVLAHWDFGYAIIACIVVHAGGALWHEFIRKDNVLRRMLPGTPMRLERERRLRGESAGIPHDSQDA